MCISDLLGNWRSAGFRRTFRIWQSDLTAGILDVLSGESHKDKRKRDKEDGASSVSEEVYYKIATRR